MDFDTSWDIDQYQLPYEPVEHWELKAEFMIKHKSNFPEDRLVCLSQVYCNITLLGCRYPSALMRQVSVLSEGLGSKYLDKKKNLLSRHFVAASNAAQQKVQRKSFSGKNVVFEKSKVESKPKKAKIVLQKPSMMFVKASETNKEDNLSSVKSQNDQSEAIEEAQVKLWSRFSHSGRSSFNQNPSNNDDDDNLPSKVQNNSCDKGLPSIASSSNNKRGTSSNPVVLSDKDESLASIEDKAAPSSSSIKVKSIKRQKITWDEKVSANTDKIPTKTKRQEISSDGGNDSPKKSPLSSSSSSSSQDINDPVYKRQLNQLLNKIKRKKRLKNPLETYFLLDHNLQCPSSILHISAQFSEVQLDIESQQTDDDSESVSLSLDGQHITDGSGETLKLARANLCENALSYLQNECWTLQKNKVFCPDEDKVSMAEVVVGSVEPSKIKMSRVEKATLDKSIQTDNKGMQLMKLMGWSGGGLGKAGEGIVEPVRPSNLFGRFGLGSTNYERATVMGKGNVSGQNTDRKNMKCNSTASYLVSNVVEDVKFSLDDIDVKEFRRYAMVILEQFAHNFDMEDMAFTPEFSHEHRKVIHELSRRYGVKTKSYGKDSARFLIVSKKRTWKELIAYVIEKGGRTEKFELFAPGKSRYKDCF